jgi:hypothetical protein
MQQPSAAAAAEEENGKCDVEGGVERMKKTR